MEQHIYGCMINKLLITQINDNIAFKKSQIQEQ